MFFLGLVCSLKMCFVVVVSGELLVLMKVIVWVLFLWKKVVGVIRLGFWFDCEKVSDSRFL